jgi:thiamine-phosphate pyrophosphorylase
LLKTIESALEGGVRAVQLREKDLTAAELYPLARDMRALTAHYKARLLINDRIDIALAVGADGVHLGGHSLSTETARQLLGPRRMIGVSTHAFDEIQSAEQQGADFVTFGPVYPTPSKAPFGPPQGIDALAEACRKSRLPVFALGGVNLARREPVRQAGAFGIALISAIIADRNPTEIARSFLA